MPGLSFCEVSFDTPTGLGKNGDEERRDELDFVGESGPTVFFGTGVDFAGVDFAGVGVFFGVGGDLGAGERSGVCVWDGAAFGEGGGAAFFGVGTDFDTAAAGCFGVEGG